MLGNRDNQSAWRVLVPARFNGFASDQALAAEKMWESVSLQSLSRKSIHNSNRQAGHFREKYLCNTSCSISNQHLSPSYE